MLRYLLAVSLCVASFHAFSADAREPRRFALVIGNNAYEGTPAFSILARAVADARAYGRVLSEERGFEVTMVLDAGRSEMMRALSAFVAKIEPGDTAMFVYSGHAVQMDPNRRDMLYLLPTDIREEDANAYSSLDLFFEVYGMRFTTITRRLAEAGAKLRVYVLDACRNRPGPPPDPGTRASGLDRGLTKLTPSRGEMIFYSAGEGQLALDALRGEDPTTSGTSVFTRVFLEEFKEGVALEVVANEVSARVKALAATDDHLQEPWLGDGVTGWACLENDCKRATVDPNVAIEASFWKACETEDDPAFCQAYLNKFPTGPRADLAELRRDRLSRVRDKKIEKDLEEAKKLAEALIEDGKPPRRTVEDTRPREKDDERLARRQDPASGPPPFKPGPPPLDQSKVRRAADRLSSGFRHVRGFGDEVISVAVDRSGEQIAIARKSGERPVVIYEIETGRELAQYPLGKTLGRRPQMRFSPSGRMLYVFGKSSMLVMRRDGQSIRAGAPFDISGAPRFTSDGSQMLIFANDWLQVYDTESVDLLHQVPLENGLKVKHIDFAPEGSFAGIATEEGWIEIHDVKTGRRLARRRASGTIQHLQFSPDGRWFVTSANRYGKSLIWQLEKGRAIPSDKDIGSQPIVFAHAPGLLRKEKSFLWFRKGTYVGVGLQESAAIGATRDGTSGFFSGWRYGTMVVARVDLAQGDIRWRTRLSDLSLKGFDLDGGTRWSKIAFSPDKSVFMLSASPKPPRHSILMFFDMSSGEEISRVTLKDGLNEIIPLDGFDRFLVRTDARTVHLYEARSR